jgi:hypothetical protein
MEGGNGLLTAGQRFPTTSFRRMKMVSQEEAWSVMKNAGYGYQIAEGWQQINPDSVLGGQGGHGHLHAGPARRLGEQLMQGVKRRASVVKTAGL